MGNTQQREPTLPSSDDADTGHCGFVRHFLPPGKEEDGRCGLVACKDQSQDLKWHPSSKTRFRFEADDEPFELTPASCMDRNRDSFNPRMLLPLDEFNHEIFIVPAREAAGTRPSQATSPPRKPPESQTGGGITGFELPSSLAPLPTTSLGLEESTGTQLKCLLSLGSARRCTEVEEKKPCTVLELPKVRLHRPSTAFEELCRLKEASAKHTSAMVEIRRYMVAQHHCFVVFEDISASASLASRLKSSGPAAGSAALSERTIATLAVGILQALQELHDDNIVAGALLPETIFTSPASSVGPLAPWGQLQLVVLPRMAPFSVNNELPSQQMRFFSAPELHQNETQPAERSSAFDPAADIWSLGVVIYLLLSGRYPHASVRPTEVAPEEVLRRGQWSFEPSEAWTDVSPGAKEFLRNGLLQTNPKLRASAKEALAHPWVSTLAGGKDVPLKHGFRITSINNASAPQAM